MKKQIAIAMVAMLLLSVLATMPVMSVSRDESNSTLTDNRGQTPYVPEPDTVRSTTYLPVTTISPVCEELQKYLDCVSTKKADIVFVFDTTGSMGDEISEMKSIAKDFADGLASSGIDYRLGLTEFRDFPVTCGGTNCGSSGDFAYKVYNGGVLTSSASTFKSWIDGLSASGGADWEESTLAALMHTAVDQRWRGGDASKIVILISDAPPHPDGHCCNQEGNKFSGVISALTRKGITAYVVGPDEDSMKKIASTTGGKFYLIRAEGVTLKPILEEITGVIKCSFDIVDDVACEDNRLEVCVQLRGKDNVLIPYRSGYTKAWMYVRCPDGTTHRYDLKYDATTRSYCATVDPVCEGAPGVVGVTVYGKVCEWSAVGRFEVTCEEPCEKCLTVDATINKEVYSFGEILAYKVSVTNEQEEKGRIAITYGYIDPTPETHIIGTFMPDIYPDDAYSFGADFKVLDDFYSGKYVFFATAIDIHNPECAESDAKQFWVKGRE